MKPKLARSDNYRYPYRMQKPRKRNLGEPYYCGNALPRSQWFGWALVVQLYNQTTVRGHKYFTSNNKKTHDPVYICISRNPQKSLHSALIMVQQTNAKNRVRAYWGKTINNQSMLCSIVALHALHHNWVLHHDYWLCGCRFMRYSEVAKISACFTHSDIL